MAAAYTTYATLKEGGMCTLSVLGEGSGHPGPWGPEGLPALTTLAVRLPHLISSRPSINNSQRTICLCKAY